MMTDMKHTASVPRDAAPLTLDATYARLADELRVRWRPDLPVGRWLAASWHLVRALRESHGQGWPVIADELNARGVRRDRGLALSETWLRRRVYSVALWSVHELERSQISASGRGEVGELPDWFLGGPLLGGSGGRRIGGRRRV